MVGAAATSMPKGMGQQPKSLLDGVFTSGQASEGEMTFQRVCVSCHDADEFKWLSNS
jgi:cytochrome c5